MNCAAGQDSSSSFAFRSSASLLLRLVDRLVKIKSDLFSSTSKAAKLACNSDYSRMKAIRFVALKMYENIFLIFTSTVLFKLLKRSDRGTKHVVDSLIHHSGDLQMVQLDFSFSFTS